MKSRSFSTSLISKQQLYYSAQLFKLVQAEYFRMQARHETCYDVTINIFQHAGFAQATNILAEGA